MKYIKKYKYIVLAGIMILLATITFFFYKKAMAGQVTSEQYNKPIVVESWSKEKEDEAKKAWKLTPSGLAYNGTFITATPNKMYPFFWKPFLEKRPGSTVPEQVKPFMGRYIYCVANHTQNYSLEFGTQAYFERLYNTKDGRPDFTPDDFNFIMLAEACYYPGTPELSRVYDHPAGTPTYLVSQSIAWMATEGAFNDQEPFAAALHKFKSSSYYDAIVNVDFTDQPVHNMLNAKTTSKDAIEAGCVNVADAYFYDIWRSAIITSGLSIDWEKEQSIFNVTAKLEDDGQYHAYVDLFKTPELQKYLNGITFSASGDWQYVGQTAEGLSHFLSPTGKAGEDGSIGMLHWPVDKVGFLVPKDIASAKLATFQFYGEALGKDPGFKNSQTYFASDMEKDLQIYVKLGSGGDNGDSDIKVNRYQHDENWNANYNVNLIKYDSETGKPLADSHWDILEAFDDSQLDPTDLDLDGPEGYHSNLGSLNPTSWKDGDELSDNYSGVTGLNTSDANRYNWKNGNGSQFQKWSDPDHDPCDRDDNVTGQDGYLNEINSNGADSGKSAHTDTKRYLYSKGYCSGHPAPVVEYAEIPEPQYDEETGDCTNEDEIASVEEENQRLHDNAWAAWYAEVETCEHLVSEGGFFHAIEPGAAQKAMEADRDQFYKDFISLTYDYSAKEIKAAPGYILHGTHKDDIPIEWRTVTSSEYKATDEAEDVSYSGGRNISDTSSSDFFKHPLSDLSEKEEPTDELQSYQSPNRPKTSNEEKTSDKKDEFVFEDGDRLEDDVEYNENKKQKQDSKEVDATPSNATPANALPAKGKRIYTGLTSKNDDIPHLLNNKKSGGVNLLPSIANTIDLPNPAIVDWTFTVYDHRTEGEFHISKRDFNSSQQEGFNCYSMDNGDGSLEGAVYGLFAANDIGHPDGHTGTVFKKDDLVSVAATDRNGDASFMAVTEAPGYTFDYNTGTIVKTDGDWPNQAPKNLYTNQTDADAKEQDNERFLGHTASNSNLSITDSSYEDTTCYKKHSSNQGVDGTGTAGAYYPIQNNEDNNGNCWIGRPLFVQAAGTQYYVKELSRSEGYELSVYGKDPDIMSNREAFVTGGGSFTAGKAEVSKIDMDKLNGGNTFTVSSADTIKGYYIHAKNIPGNAHFYTTSTEYVWDDSVTHPEEKERKVPVYATDGSYVLISGSMVEAAVGDTINLPNGTSATVNKAFSPDLSKTTVEPGNVSKITGTVLAPGTDTGDIIKDINQLLSMSGYRDTDQGSPWMLVPISEGTQEAVCEALNAEVLENKNHRVFNALRLSDIIDKEGNKYAVISYAYKYASTVPSAIFNEDTQKLFVKKDATYQDDKGTPIKGYFYKEYSLDECFDYETNAAGFVTSAVIPNEIPSYETINYLKDNIQEKVTYTIPASKSYWVYADGEQLRSGNGDYEFKVEKYFEDVSPTQVVKTINKELTDVTYAGNYEYILPIDPSTIPANGRIDFRIKLDDDQATVNGNIVSAQSFIYANGIISINIPLAGTDSYIVEAFLTYPGEKNIISDAGTIAAPCNVLERPIRQQIRVRKDILTNPDGSYANDTYSKVHKENLSADGHNRWYNKAADWLTGLINGNSTNESTSKVDNFRFKAYLKSNLERLYRDENGNVAWLDRNGNLLKPNYLDTNGDGNYDTFTWSKAAQDGSGDTVIDFPEKQLVDEDGLKSSNVQKIYTKVEHNTGSTTTGDNSNNIWSTYNDPQTGTTENVGEFIGFTTSNDGTNGEAIRTNASLYSYDGNNLNVKKTDRINEGQNTGYTRLLEITSVADEDTQMQAYNYKKFFDAIYTANTDKWDNDMFSSDKNYPGQNWFGTFYEKYQKDDADPDHTIENTDGIDQDNTAGGDRDTSFKPFQWIRENVFKENGQEQDYYNGTANNPNIENTINTSTIAHENAEASDAVRQFAIDYYLQDEVAKLVQNNGQDEDEAIPVNGKMPTYTDEVYDRALHAALIKAVNYLKPFYDNDLDTIYSVEWDTEANGGADNDYTTLNVKNTEGNKGYYYAVSSYLPYGTYIVVEQQPGRIDGTINDFTNKNYKTDLPKEVTLPSLYNGDKSNDTFDNFNPDYFYDTAKTPEDLAKNYYIRFNEEWADNHTDDLRNYVIRAHNNDGDYEIYKYGLDVDKLISSITYDGGTYDYKGFSVTQETSDPLKDYYNPIHKVNGKNVMSAEGSNDNSHYFADDGNDATETANGSHYATNAIEERYHYGSISEHSGEINGFKTMTGNQTAYEGKYASMLVPWSVTTPVDSDSYKADDFAGFADIGFHNTFYKVNLRIEKIDSETGENILHDGAVFGLYAASRYTTQAEVDEAIANGAPETTKIGNVKFYLKDTTITGTYEFLASMKADNIRPYEKLFGKNTNLYAGIVPAGTPVCLESEQIILYDELGAKTGDMTVYSTMNDVNMVAEEDTSKAYKDQNVGYFITPQPIGAGVYVLAELKPPTGYSRTKPIAIEIYSDAVTYYINGDMNSQVRATIYTGSLSNQDD